MLADKFNHTRKDWDDNDGKYHYGKVIFYYSDITEIVTGKNKRCYPGNTSDDIIADEVPVGHTADTCHKRREGPDDRNKTGNDDRLAAVFFKKLVRPVQVLFVEKTNMLFMEYFGPHKTPYPVIHCVAQNGGDWEENKKPHNIEISSRREGACREKKWVAGENRRHHKSSLTKNNKKKNEVGPHTVGLDNLAQMHINVYDELKNNFYEL